MGVKVKVGPKYQVVIPQDIRKKVPIFPKDEVLIEEINGLIIILPKPESFTEFMLGQGKDVWKGINPKAHVRKERRSWK